MAGYTRPSYPKIGSRPSWAAVLVSKPAQLASGCGKLHLVEARVEPVGSSKSVGGACSTISPLFATRIQFGVQHGAQPVGNDKRAGRSSTVPALPAPGSLSLSREEVASSRMRMRRSFRMARAMAMRWRWPPLNLTPCSPTVVFVAVLQIVHDEEWGVGGDGCGFHFPGRCLQPPIANVVIDTAGKQDRFLGHNADLLAQAAHRNVAQIVAVDGDAAVYHVVEAGDKIHQCVLLPRRWARPGR